MPKHVLADLDCAALADYAGEESEYKRLFKRGIDRGRTYWEASERGKIEQKDINREVPNAFMVTALSQPIDGDVPQLGADFVLGQLWGMARQNAMNLAYDTKSNPARDQKVAATIAKNAFSAKNCSLL
jgi:hypothetical protein